MLLFMKTEIKMNNIIKHKITKITPENITESTDHIAVEEPLEIIIRYGSAQKREHKTIAVTMRTPCEDVFLAIGFLYTEGIIAHKEDVVSCRFLEENRIIIELRESFVFEVEKLNRHFYTTSSCGVCGKASIEAISTNSCFILKKNYPIVSKHIIFNLTAQLFDNQSLFSKTGGVHASALFQLSENDENTVEARNPDSFGKGPLLKLFEDVGRHNALDKLIGWALQNGLLPLSNTILLVSGRVSFELVQKAIMAGIPIIVAIGAPSSLAIDLAEQNGMTLIGFLKDNSMNVYCSGERIV
jgi:FdhD protein